MSLSPTERFRERAREITPRLRGWQHTFTFPIAVLAGIVLIWLAPSGSPRAAAAVFVVCSCVLFGASSLYHLHRGRWTRWHGLFRRFDHASIFLLIAGTYTPFAVMLLHGTSRRTLLIVVWCGALAGISFRVFWIGAPRWLYLPVYLGLGWAAIFWLGDFASAANAAVLTLIIVGGGLYSLGGLVYGIKKPNPLPRYFGYHEVFHSLTIAAFVAHYVGVSVLVYGGR